MTPIFIIHGAEGHPEENWFPWLKKELEQLGHTAIVPQFPLFNDQTLANWLNVLAQYKEFITPETIFVGHSLGTAFILNVLETTPAKAAFFVAGFTGKVENKFDDSMKTFAQRTFDWQKIKEHCNHFTVFHSDNDPYVKIEKAHELAEYLEVPVNIIKGAGHFNEAAGCTKFDILLEKITELL